ncbi:MAG: hypothetical protein IMZ53_08440 [Thermoplasmata archaeon]|nr:hypothetical protein [Thermoplasmata archaeon]MBE3140597.1 hypothetical protein [Thermoplasmata archaeon]
MSGHGKKLEEVFTIRASFDGGTIDNNRTMAGYPSMDEAVGTARKLYKDFSKTKENRKYYKNLDVSVCFGEFKYESGDILGEPTCLSIKDLKTPKRKEQVKKPYYIPEPFGLPFELTKKDTFRKLNEK